MFRTFLAIAALILCASAPAWAQETETQEDVVVSGFRASARAAVYAQLPIPAISTNRRADSVIIAVTVGPIPATPTNAAPKSSARCKTWPNAAAAAP